MKMKMLIKTISVCLLLNNTVHAEDQLGCNNTENFSKEKFNKERYSACKEQVANATSEYDSCIAKNTQNIQTETEDTSGGKKVTTNSAKFVINDGAC
ncbi:MAG: hypothetical protein ACXVLQ_13595, partial [Bacteriovorax sp.]